MRFLDATRRLFVSIDALATIQSPSLVPRPTSGRHFILPRKVSGSGNETNSPHNRDAQCRWTRARMVMFRFRVQSLPSGINSCKPVVFLRHQATTFPLEKEESKPFDTIPKENGLPFFGTFLNTLVFAFRFSKFFLIPFERIKKHGKIWREQPFPGLGEVVNIVDYRDVQKSLQRRKARRRTGSVSRDCRM